MNNSALKQLELETLLEITSTLFIHDNLNDLLHDILIRTCGLLDASSGFILIEEKNSDLFVPKATFNLDEKILSKIIFNKKRGFLHSLAGQNNTCLQNEKSSHQSEMEKLIQFRTKIGLEIENISNRIWTIEKELKEALKRNEWINDSKK